MRLISWLRSIRSRFSPVSVRHRLPKRALSARLGVESLEERTVLSTFTVHNLADSGAGSLRAAITAANANPGADLISFDHRLRGTVVLTSGGLNITDGLEIDGPGANKLAVSGSDVSRVFQIGSGVAASIDGLTITHGKAIGQGGGILNAGNLTLSNAVVSDNQVVGLAGVSLGTVVDAFGGGIFNTATLTVRDTTFLHNRSVGADGTAGATIGSSALGGAIMSSGTASAPATATVSHGTFVDNQAIGGAAGAGASRAGIGGAISNAAGTFTISHSVFRDNQAVGGLDNGIPGGFGAGTGGAIGNVARAGNAILAVSDSTFVDNQAIGGAAGAGGNAQPGRGGAIANYIFGGLPQPVTVTATATVTDSSLLGNQAVGGAGTTGGIGQGGGIANLNGGVLTVANSLIALNLAVGGAGDGVGGNGQGGGIFNGGSSPVGTPSLTLLHSLIAVNRAEGGPGDNDGSAGVGGGLYIAPGGLASADRWTWIFANDASTSDDDVFGILV